MVGLNRSAILATFWQSWENLRVLTRRKVPYPGTFRRKNSFLVIFKNGQKWSILSNLTFLTRAWSVGLNRSAILVTFWPAGQAKECFCSAKRPQKGAFWRQKPHFCPKTGKNGHFELFSKTALFAVLRFGCFASGPTFFKGNLKLQWRFQI